MKALPRNFELGRQPVFEFMISRTEVVSSLDRMSTYRSGNSESMNILEPNGRANGETLRINICRITLTVSAASVSTENSMSRLRGQMNSRNNYFDFAIFSL